MAKSSIQIKTKTTRVSIRRRLRLNVKKLRPTGKNKKNKAKRSHSSGRTLKSETKLARSRKPSARIRSLRKINSFKRLSE